VKQRTQGGLTKVTGDKRDREEGGGIRGLERGKKDLKGCERNDVDITGGQTEIVVENSEGNFERRLSGKSTEGTCKTLPADRLKV